jgi:hypothetical protein
MMQYQVHCNAICCKTVLHSESEALHVFPYNSYYDNNNRINVQEIM